jgi:hypothetical protein
MAKGLRVKSLCSCVLLVAAFLCASSAHGQVDGGAGDLGDAAAAPLAPPDAAELQALKERVRLLESRLEDDEASLGSVHKDHAAIKRTVKELAEAIQFSGFFDMSVSTYRNNPNVFALGSFEFDLKKAFNRYTQVGAALVFADSKADLAVGFIDLHLFGGLIPARGNIFLESGFHVQVGKFDVPFGNDWVYFASLDRPTMSAPLTTAMLMEGGYNDVGLRALGNWRFVNYVGYLLKGAGEGLAVGGRLAFVPFNNPFTMKRMDAQPLDLGLSLLRDLDQAGNTEETTWAVDVEARYEFLRVQAEYYHRHDRLHALHRDGYQASLFACFFEDGPLPLGFGVRHDTVRDRSDDGTADERLRRVTVAGFIRPFDVTVLKLEFFEYLDGSVDLNGRSVFAQLVIGFK